MKKTLFLPLFLLFGICSNSFSQGSDFDRFLVASENDARILLSNYSEPLLSVLGYGFANSWYNTAETHKPLGFDITGTVNAVMWPSNAQTFNTNGLNFEAISNAPSEMETILGPGNITETFNISYEDVDPSGVRYRVDESLAVPGGVTEELDLPFEALPVPMAQLGIGTFKNTDLKLRFTPKIATEDLEFQMYGAGIMHDVTQWIPGLKLTPVHISILAGYSRITASYGLEGSGLPGNNQIAELAVDSWTYQILVSKNLSIFTLYGGIGGNSGSTSFDMRGSYEYNAVNVDTGGEYTRVLNDPLSIASDISSFRATAGFRLKLAIITIHADYTLQKYPIISTGIGLTVR